MVRKHSFEITRKISYFKSKLKKEEVEENPSKLDGENSPKSLFVPAPLDIGNGPQYFLTGLFTLFQSAGFD